MQIAKKISIATINGTRGGFRDVTAERFVGRLLGIARKVDVKDTTYGPSLKFLGDFKAINEDGEEVVAPVMYLPSPADQLLSEALAQAGGNEVKFAFDVFVTPKEKKTPVDLGYAYVVRPLLETKPSDPMAELLSQVSAPLPALAAPKQPALPGTEQAPADAPTEPEAKPAKKK